MEKIINYKLKDFLQITDIDLISDYLQFLELLNPIVEISNPNYKCFNLKKVDKKIKIKHIQELTFGEVTTIKNHFSTGEVDNILESVMMLTGLTKKQILDFTIVAFYGIISSIKYDLIQIENMEFNELNNDDEDVFADLVKANERLSKYGVINVFDMLSNGDVTKWDEIEKLPYMTVFTKLSMNAEKNKIQKEIAELQKKKIIKE